MYYDYGFGFGGFDAFGAMFTIVFLLMVILIGMQLVKGIGEWNKNNQSPKLTVPATVVAKRDYVTQHRHENHTGRTTSYYVTFQVESGDRMELRLSGTEYGQLAEGDTGRLSFQGTRYLGFERN